jgi:hypothetical protein
VGISLPWFLYINDCGCSSLSAVVTETGTNEMTNKPKKTRVEREAELEQLWAKAGGRAEVIELFL